MFEPNFNNILLQQLYDKVRDFCDVDDSVNKEVFSKIMYGVELLNNGENNEDEMTINNKIREITYYLYTDDDNNDESHIEVKDSIIHEMLKWFEHKIFDKWLSHPEYITSLDSDFNTLKILSNNSEEEFEEIEFF